MCKSIVSLSLPVLSQSLSFIEPILYQASDLSSLSSSSDQSNRAYPLERSFKAFPLIGVLFLVVFVCMPCMFVPLCLMRVEGTWFESSEEQERKN